MKIHGFSPIIVYETSIPGFSSYLKSNYKYHSFDSSNGLITGELNGKVLIHNDDKFTDFFKQVSLKISEYLDFFNFKKDLYNVNFVKSWYTVCDPQFNVPPHHHSCSHISYVYYISVENNDPLLFSVNNENEWFGDAFTFCDQRDNINATIHSVQPSSESLLIFPGKLMHFTNSSRKKNRMCIAGDIFLTLKEDMLDYESGMLPTTYWRKF